MLVSSAASLVGGLIGFLFGIPQSNTSNTVVERSSTRVGAIQRVDAEAIADTASPRQDLGQATSEAAAVTGRETAITGREAGRGSGLHRNTNLESISDALTKGLLAIGASQLYRVHEWVKSLGSALGESFGPGNGGQIVALSILTYGTIEGFLFGYLATRIYLTNVFERSDPKA